MGWDGDLCGLTRALLLRVRPASRSAREHDHGRKVTVFDEELAKEALTIRGAGLAHLGSQRCELNDVLGSARRTRACERPGRLEMEWRCNGLGPRDRTLHLSP